jgi:2-polyprenyl-3-methyl-5-hydroxy-6-metoxy-1,4-benzoquinol methylase
MNDNNEILKSGTFATKQIFSACKILRWSHQARFKKAFDLVSHYKANTILDYGCGDGTFLLFVDKLYKRKVGIEINPQDIQNLKNRFHGLDSFQFKHLNEKLNEKFDIVTCFEVLEHCSDENIEKIFVDILKSYCSKDGHIIISVPKETGLTMIGKQLVRRFLALKKTGTYEYSEWYSFSEFFQMLFATQITQINRKSYDVELEGIKFKAYGHKGFNWKILKQKIENHFEIEKIEFSPQLLPFGLIASQVWFICRQKR